MKKVLLTMLGSIVLLSSADGMKRSNSAVWTQKQIADIADEGSRQLRIDHEDYKKTIRSNFAKAKNISELDGNQVYNKEEKSVLKDGNKDVFSEVPELKDLKTEEELKSKIEDMASAGAYSGEYVDGDNNVTQKFTELFEKRTEPYSYAEMQTIIDDANIKEATKNLFTQDDVDAKVAEGKKGLFTQDDVDAKVAEAKTKADEEKMRLIDGNKKRMNALSSAGLKYDKSLALEIVDNDKFETYFKLSETNSEDVSSKDEGQKTEKNEDVDNDKNASVTLGSEKAPEAKKADKAQKTAKAEEPAEQKTTVRRLKH